MHIGTGTYYIILHRKMINETFLQLVLTEYRKSLIFFFFFCKKFGMF